MKKWNLAYATILLTGLLGSMPLAAQEDIENFLCSLKVVKIMTNKRLVDIKDQPVRIGSNGKAKVFDGVIQAIYSSPAMFLVESNYKSSGRENVPELNIGIYNPNKFKPTEPSLVAGAVGDARAFAKLNSTWVTGDLRVHFSCKNRNYRSI